MGMPVMIIGKSGSGKTTSLRNFAEKEIYLIKVLKKPLPFRKEFESTFETEDYDRVLKALEKSGKNSIVIDDAGYLLTNHFMNGHMNTGSGNGVFALYNEIADRFWRLVEYVINVLPPEKIVYFMMHEDRNDLGEVKPKTIGKLLDEKVCLEGMFTIVLRCMKDGGRHVFKTKTNGADVTKTPIGMFEEDEIENDLKKVDDTIRSFYRITEGGTKE